jgi:methylthioribulose-1-phosphate dehydratase
MNIKSELKKLISYSKTYYQNGIMPATAGNLSIFDRNKNQIFISASGKNKGELKKRDFLILDSLKNEILISNGNKPSAETSIHQAVYKRIESANVCIHVHTISSCKLKFNLQKQDLPKRFLLPNLEILKAFGDFTENPNFAMIVNYNHVNVKQISDEFELAISEKKSDVPFFLIENHGITVWGRDVDDANKNLEAADFILKVMV